MKDKNLYKVSVYDILLIGALVVSPVLALSPLWLNDQNNEEVFVYQDNKLIEVQSLNQTRVISLTNIQVDIDKGKIRVVESNCPKHICMHIGWIDRPGQTIVCVPNKTMIEVRGRQRSKYHATSY